MTTTCEPLWLDGWEQEADEKASIHRRQPRRRAKKIPADYGRPCSRPDIPSRRAVDVIRSL
ncbi:hypothetical protein ABT154_21500 [Streptomyces sp. NPDC001728]|uniref:hypothetical protein n=1 Tax=Streptomyces sp. NPDC001728 TaxID=3154396 RepID=UPI00331B5E8B